MRICVWDSVRDVDICVHPDLIWCVTDAAEKQSRDSQASRQRVIDLDYVPYSKLNYLLSHLSSRTGSMDSPQSSCRATDGASTQVITLELTILDPSLDLAPLSSGFSLALFPFLPCITGNGHRHSKPRSTTPLNKTLPDLISQLERHHLRIISVIDVSKERESKLWDDASKLEAEMAWKRDEDTGEGKGKGRGWREAGLKCAWEASLLEGGMLRRWRVIVDVGGGRESEGEGSVQ